MSIKINQEIKLIIHYIDETVHICDCFFLPTLQILKDGQLTICYKIVNKQICIVKHKTVKSCNCTKRYCVSKMNRLMSGDIELNPGPEQNVCDQTALSVGSTLLLNYRLRQLGLRPLDVGGAGDCFF